MTDVENLVKFQELLKEFKMLSTQQHADYLKAIDRIKILTEKLKVSEDSHISRNAYNSAEIMWKHNSLNTLSTPKDIFYSDKDDIRGTIILTYYNGDAKEIIFSVLSTQRRQEFLDTGNSVCEYFKKWYSYRDSGFKV